MQTKKILLHEVPTETQFSFPAMMANTAEALLTKSRIEEKSVLTLHRMKGKKSVVVARTRSQIPHERC